MAKRLLAGLAVLALAMAGVADAQMGGGGMGGGGMGGGGMGGGGMGGGGHHSRHNGDQSSPPQKSTPGVRPGDSVNFCGKVVALVQDGCVGIVGQAQTVELTSVTPKPAVGTLISGVGVFGNDMNICMQGMHMRTATWKAAQSCDQ